MKNNHFIKLLSWVAIGWLCNACSTITEASKTDAQADFSGIAAKPLGGGFGEVTDEVVWADASRYDKPVTYPQTTREKLMLRELNMVRANPKAYIAFVETYIKNQERGIAIPRTPTITTSSTIRKGVKTTRRDTVWSGGGFDKSKVNKNAVAAARQLIGELQKLKPLPMLMPSECLTKAAKDQGDFCKSVGKLTHTGKNGAQIHERLPKFCIKLGNGAENLCAGSATVREGLLQLLVDTSVPDRGHRKNILNAEHNMIGVYEAGRIKDMNSSWVQEFGH